MEFLIVIAAFSIIIALCVKGWQIALTDKLYEEAEQHAQNRFEEYVATTRYRLHIRTGVIDEMKQFVSKVLTKRRECAIM